MGEENVANYCVFCSLGFSQECPFDEFYSGVKFGSLDAGGGGVLSCEQYWFYAVI